MAAHCGGDVYSRRKPLFSSFGEHTAVCGSSVRQAVARPRHRQSVCIHNIHVAATCRPSVLGSATMRGHMWLNKVASVLGSATKTRPHVVEQSGQCARVHRKTRMVKRLWSVSMIQCYAHDTACYVPLLTNTNTTTRVLVSHNNSLRQGCHMRFFFFFFFFFFAQMRRLVFTLNLRLAYSNIFCAEF